MARLANSEFDNMKKSSDWVRQPGLDKKLDHLVDERGCTPAELIPYDAAKVLDIEPSGEFYRKVRDWKQRRAAESDRPILEVPAHVQAEFRDVLGRFTSEAMDSFLRAVRNVGGDLNRAATLRVADAERRAENASAEVNELIDRWSETEAELETTREWASSIEQELAEADHREIEMRVRLEERDALLKSFGLQQPTEGEVPIIPSHIDRARPTVDESNGDGSSANGNVTDGDMAVPAGSDGAENKLPAAGEERVEQSSAIEADPPAAAQPEVSLFARDDAEQANIGDEGHG